MKHGIVTDRSAAAAALACMALALLAGCANTTERHQELALSSLQHALAGAYSSSASAAASATASSSANAAPNADTAVSLTISPVTAQLIGDAVYFVRETPGDNTGLVLWQGVWTLTAAPGGKHGKRGKHHDEVRIVQHSFLFKDPRRWSAAASNPDLLESMLPQDLQALPGCDLVWHTTEQGYETDSSSACQPGTHASGLWVEQQAKLNGAELSLTQRLVDNSGTLDQRDAPLVLHLSRGGAAP